MYYKGYLTIKELKEKLNKFDENLPIKLLFHDNSDTYYSFDFDKFEEFETKKGWKYLKINLHNPLHNGNLAVILPRFKNKIKQMEHILYKFKNEVLNIGFNFINENDEEY